MRVFHCLPRGNPFVLFCDGLSGGIVETGDDVTSGRYDLSVLWSTLLDDGAQVGHVAVDSLRCWRFIVACKRRTKNLESLSRNQKS